VQYQNLYYRAELERLSLTDGMTGAANRRAHDLRIEQWATEGRTFMYYLVDLDNFKEINDVMGHAEGDRVICEAIQALQSVVREGDLVARYGGDEFAVFCDSADDQMIGRLRTALRVRRINASIGVAISPRDGVTPDEIKKAADVAMYDEKQRHHQQYEAGRPETRRQSDAQRF
jgi:diguanylate cyclase (GGDEF)-like protein